MIIDSQKLIKTPWLIAFLFDLHFNSLVAILDFLSAAFMIRDLQIQIVIALFFFCLFLPSNTIQFTIPKSVQSLLKNAFNTFYSRVNIFHLHDMCVCLQTSMARRIDNVENCFDLLKKNHCALPSHQQQKQQNRRFNKTFLLFSATQSKPFSLKKKYMYEEK